MMEGQETYRERDDENDPGVTPYKLLGQLSDIPNLN